MKAKAETW